MSAFIGRNRELDALEAALMEAAVGDGNCVLVSGEAGIGKSRVVREARRRAKERGFTIHNGACEEPDAAVAFAAVATMLRNHFRPQSEAVMVAELGPLAHDFSRLLPELGTDGAEATRPRSARAPCDGGSERPALFEALGRWLEEKAGTGPQLLIMEDLHWSDDASLACLAYLVQRLQALPHLIILSFRTPVADSTLEGFVKGISRQARVRHLQLQPLSRQEVALVMHSVTGDKRPIRFYFLARVFDVTGGNPLFVEELCLSSTATDTVSGETDLLGLHPRPQAAIPRSIRRIIRQRVQDVSRAAQQIADLCAVHGREFDLKLLRALTGYAGERLCQLCEELVNAHLAIEASPGQYAFRHALIREALIDRLLLRERRALHGRLAAGLEEVYCGSLQPHLADLSYHAYEAGCWRQALPYCRLAAERALALGAPRAAALQLTRAIGAASKLSTAPSWELHCLRAKALEQLGDVDGALTDYAMALDNARVLNEGQAEEAVLRELAAFLPTIGLRQRYYGQIMGAQAGNVEEASR